MQVADACKPDAQPVEFRLYHVQPDNPGKLAPGGRFDNSPTTKRDPMGLDPTIA